MKCPLISQVPSHLYRKLKSHFWCFCAAPVVVFLVSGRHIPRYLESKMMKYGRVSFCNGSFYDSLLWPLSSRTERSRLVVHRCRNSSVFSLLTAPPALFRCACVSSFPILVNFFKSTVIFPPMASIKKTEKKKKPKQMTLHSFLMSSEPRPGPSSAK